MAGTLRIGRKDERRWTTHVRKLGLESTTIGSMPGPVARPRSSNRSRTITAEVFGTAPPTKMPPGLGTAGRRAWKRFWASPVARTLLEVDISLVERWAKLHDVIDTLDVVDRDWDRAAGRLAQLETALGIGPGSRARIGLQVDDTHRIARLDLDE